MIKTESKVDFKNIHDEYMDKVKCITIKIFEALGIKDACDLKELCIWKDDINSLSEKYNPIVKVSEEVNGYTVYSLYGCNHPVYGKGVLCYVIDFDYFKVIYFPF